MRRPAPRALPTSGARGHSHHDPSIQRGDTRRPPRPVPFPFRPGRPADCPASRGCCRTSSRSRSGPPASPPRSTAR